VAAFFSGVLYALALNLTLSIGLFALASLAGHAHSRKNRITIEDVHENPPEMLDYYGIVVVANCKAILEMVRTIERHDQGSFHQAHNLWRIEAAKAPKPKVQ
jgi:hypothetical protein